MSQILVIIIGVKKKNADYLIYCSSCYLMMILDTQPSNNIFERAKI